MKLLTFNHAKFAFASIGLHLLLLILGSFYLLISKPPSAFIGNDQINIVNAFIYSGESSAVNTKMNMVQKEVKENKNAIIHEKKILSVNENKSSAQTTKNSGRKIQGDNANELLALLHAAIQKEQQYPDSALQLEREGRVTVQFLLRENGEASHIQVAKTSGTESLDQAAVIAVQNASPFVNAKKLLKDAKEYQIDVVFKLA